jgi:hypothetical protein
MSCYTQTREGGCDVADVTRGVVWDFDARASWAGQVEDDLRLILAGAEFVLDGGEGAEEEIGVQRMRIRTGTCA